MLKDYDSLQTTIRNLREEVDYLKKENAQQARSLKDDMDEIRKLTEANSSLKQQNDLANQKIRDLLAEIDRLNDVLDKKIAESEMCIEKTLKENIELRKRFESFQGQGTKISEYEKRIQGLLDENKSLNDQLNSLRRKYEEDLDRLRASEEENRQNKMRLESLKDSLNHAERSVNMTRESLSIETEQLKKQANSIPELTARIANLERDLQGSRNEIATLRQTISLKDEEIARLRRELQDLQASYSRDKQVSSEEKRKLQI